MSNILSVGDLARIRNAVAAAETRTAGEIFVVVARASDDYRALPLLWATLASLLVPLPFLFFTTIAVFDIYLVQLIVFAVLAVALSLPPLHLRVVPRPLKLERAHAKAVEQFLAHGLHTTEARTGVLVFVSLAERYAEIVADTGIAAKVGQDVWDSILRTLTGAIGAGRLGDGLAGAVEESGAVLATHFPIRSGDRNELPNEVIIL